MRYTASTFENALSDAIRWCNWRMAKGGFQPDEHTARLDALSPSEWSANFQINIERLLTVRRQKITQIGEADRGIKNWPGSILVFVPDYSIHDGIAQLECGGLFDVHACPIYDFWIGVAGEQHERLLSWIPEPIKLDVDHAMQVDAPKCLAWLG